VSFVTEPFRSLAGATAKGKRVPDLPIIVLPMGYDQRPEDEVRADVRQRVPQVLAALTKTHPSLAGKAGARMGGGVGANPDGEQS